MVVGDFNPEAINPHWLAFHELISAAEAEEATTQTSTFSVQIDLGWCKLYVDPNRIQILTSQSPWVRALDFVLKFLTDLLPSNASTALGINISRHFPLSFKEREEFGHRLAPREPWGKWGERLFNTQTPANGLNSITMRQASDLEAPFNSYIDVKVSTSPILKATGIRIYVNDHYTFAEDPKSKLSTAIAAETLEANFERSLARSGEIIDDIMDGIKS